MKTEIQVEIGYSQILSLVKALPVQQKIKLGKELEKDAIKSKLSKILKNFKSSDLSLDTINKEVELVRQNIYESQKH